MKLRSYKLNCRERRVRAVPATDDAGCPFEGPGVDLLGVAAEEVIALAAGMFAWVSEREPGMSVRSMSVDLERGRVLMTFDAGATRPIVLRVDPPASVDLLSRGEPLATALAAQCSSAIAKR